MPASQSTQTSLPPLTSDDCAGLLRGGAFQVNSTSRRRGSSRGNYFLHTPQLPPRFVTLAPRKVIHELHYFNFYGRGRLCTSETSHLTATVVFFDSTLHPQRDNTRYSSMFFSLARLGHDGGCRLDCCECSHSFAKPLAENVALSAIYCPAPRTVAYLIPRGRKQQREDQGGVWIQKHGNSGHCYCPVLLVSCPLSGPPELTAVNTLCNTRGPVIAVAQRHWSPVGHVHDGGDVVFILTPFHFSLLLPLPYGSRPYNRQYVYEWTYKSMEKMAAIFRSSDPNVQFLSVVMFFLKESK